MDFWIEKDIFEKLHMQQETEIVYMIEGEALARMDDRKYKLQKDSVILFNSGVLHALQCCHGSVIGRAVFTGKEISAVLKGVNVVFDCSSQVWGGYSCEPVAHILRKLVNNTAFSTARTECMKFSLLYELLDCLIENYALQMTPDKIREFNDNERLQFILRYVNQNFKENIRLADLAEKLYTSPSSLSRFFKKYTGSYFTEYIKQIRLNDALDRILHTNDSMTKIAMDCGFANPSVFTHTFQAAFGMAPNTYRKQNRRKVQTGNTDRTKTEKHLITNLNLTNGTGFEMKRTTVSVNMAKGEGSYWWKKCNETMNFGAAEHLTKVRLQKHVLYLKEKLGMRYVRLWNIFSNKMEFTDGVHIGNYNYDILDSVFDFLIDNGLHPFLEFGRRKAVALAFPDKTVYMEDEYIVFKSRAVWEDAIKDFFHHVTGRYGKEEVMHWKFELGKNRINGEECPCYMDEAYEYFNAYAYMWKTVKSVVPEAAVGGPMGLCDFDLEFLKEFLWRCSKECCLPDFITWASFPYEESGNGNQLIHRIDPPGIVESATVKKIRAVMQEYMEEPCPLYITEWNFSVSSRNYLNDSCYRAVYLFRLLCRLYDDVDMLCVWVASDWISSYYDTVGIANGGNGILTKNTIPKPVCLALGFLKSMGNILLARGENYMITRTGNNELYILCCNFTGYHTMLLKNGENIETPGEIVKNFDNQEDHRIDITAEGLIPGQTYMVKKRRLNEREGSILGVWEAFGYESRLSQEDIDYIRESCRPTLTIERYHCENGCLKLSVGMGRQEMILIHVFAAV